MNDLVSIIIPIYNVEQYLNECIDSVIKQTYSNIEIILVDDGSPDKCPQICDEWVRRDSRISVIHKENGGLSDARNVGIDVIHGSYILFVDSDDWIEYDMVEKMLDVIKKEKADICACGIMYEYPSRAVIRKVDQFKGNSSETLGRLYNDTHYPVSALNKLYKCECWKKLRFPIGKLCEDAFTTYLLIDQADTIVQIPNAFYHYRIRENSIMTSNFNHKKMDEEEAWRVNYEFMSIHYPEHKKASFDFYLLRVNNLIHTIGEDKFDKYKKEYQLLRHILRKNMCYVLICSELPIKQRIKLLYDCIRV